MSAESVRLIVDSLNKDPFNLSTTLIAFDNFSPNRLLQVLSDVLCWVTQTDQIDIRNEAPDQTALRVFNNLKILKFRPPSDIEQLEEWRIGMVEGSKASIYPVLFYLFSNVEMLKERAYLAKFLVKVEVPSEIHDADTVQLQNDIITCMERFKEIHQKVVQVRGDSMLIEDIKADLRQMEQEKEQLNRRIEKIRRKVVNMPNLDRIISGAEAHRRELERFETLNVQRQEQRNAVINADQKIQRLESQLKEVRQQAETLDPSDLIAQLDEEMETNGFLMQKLEREIRTKKGVVIELARVSNLPTIDQSEVDDLKREVDAVNARLIVLEEDRDKREEGYDENFSIYRHQAATVERKKNAAASQLQEGRNDLDEMHRRLAQRKDEMRTNNGGEDVVTSLQFKNYVNKLRGMTITYKKKRGELEDIKSENLILTRTCEILGKQYQELKDKMEGMGMLVMETIEVPTRMERPKTAAPKTDDIDELRNLINDLNMQLDQKRSLVAPLKEKRDEISARLNDTLESMRNQRKDYERQRAALESNFTRLQDNVERLEGQYEAAQLKAKMAEVQVKVAEAHLEQIESGNIGQITQDIEDLTQKYQQEADTIQQRGGGQGGGSDSKKQMQMWRSLERIFELKLALARQDPSKSDLPIGDRRAGRF
ncbi:unnamed protein product, partial [Mesorhabditis belari]|uniref:Intraflagellar transport protein 81 homolog n=1 Tax=Mesorhabditis belari TaxID=2138241 RepID=A0AAF3EUV2_9BILA